MPNVEVVSTVDAEEIMHQIDEDYIVWYLGEMPRYWEWVLKMCPFDVDRFLPVLKGYLKEWREEDLEALKDVIAKIETKNKEVKDVVGL